MPFITFKDTQYELLENETILACLTRHQVSYPNSCQSGVCQSCISKLTDGQMNPEWQKGLKENLKVQNYFLPCIAKPTGDVTLSLPQAKDINDQASIISKELLTHNVLKLTLKTDNLAKWIPGQYINLVNPNNIIRSYSIANIPEDDGFIELHIKLRPDGVMSQWLIDEASLASSIIIRGPNGDCFYVNVDKVAFDILLVGTGTGLAPLIAIAKAALKLNHQGTITLLHGGLVEDDIYYVKELASLSQQYNNFVYKNCVLKGTGRYPEISIDKLMLDKLTNPQNTRIYICGPEVTTKDLKKKAFMAGAALQHIYSDAFI